MPGTGVSPGDAKMYRGHSGSAGLTLGEGKSGSTSAALAECLSHGQVLCVHLGLNPRKPPPHR